MFIKIGDLYINQDHIVSIWVSDSEVILLTDTREGDTPIWQDFSGNERQAILDWLNYKADVSKVY